MKELTGAIFRGLTMLFDSVPLLNKFKGLRSIIGFVGLAVVYGLKAQTELNPEILSYVEIGLIGFTGVALVAHKND